MHIFLDTLYVNAYLHFQVGRFVIIIAEKMEITLQNNSFYSLSLSNTSRAELGC